MKYFFDTEFIEGPQRDRRYLKFKARKNPPTIDLISIGIVAENGKTLYEISNEFNVDEAWGRYQVEVMDYNEIRCGDKATGSVLKYITEDNQVREWMDANPGWKKVHKIGDKVKVYWLRDNVLSQVFDDLIMRANIYGDERNKWQFSKSNLKTLLKLYGKSRAELKKEVLEFVAYNEHPELNPADLYSQLSKKNDRLLGDVEFYAYYADYDWVVFCWLFGRMIDLPAGFPMYCRDLKQMFDDKARRFKSKDGTLKDHKEYPKQISGHHNALADAKWNVKLYNFLENIK